MPEEKLKVAAYEKLIEIAEREEDISILKKRSQTIDELGQIYPCKVSMFCSLLC